MNNKNKTKKQIEWFLLIGLITTFIATIPMIYADECSGGSCGANFSLNVTNATIPPPVIISTISEQGQIIYGILQSSGAGIGLFMQLLSGGLVTLFIMIALISIMVAIVYAVFHAIKLWGKVTEEN